ncbi:MAG: AAA domain-containing protein [Gemmatimonadetes bacterium]|nr:AAA domain-containing protein [Gemmatimonadota bacterium]
MKLPSDVRFISLKYDGRCLSCSKPIKAGQKAHWSPSSKKVWCEECVRTVNNSRESSQSEMGDSGYVGNSVDFVGAKRSETAYVNNQHTKWRQLCLYAQRCIEAEASKSLVPYVKENSHWFMHCGQEKLVVGQSDAIPAPESLVDYLARSQQRDGQSVIYGWPTVVLTDRDNSSKVAPLFKVNIEPERNGEKKWELHATVEPEYNLAITASNVFDPSVAEDIFELLSDGLPFGDADAFVSIAGRTAGLLGLDIISRLDPFSLDTSVSRKQGVYNTAVSVVIETSSEYQATLREELRELQARKDWSTTAAAHLLSDRIASNLNSRAPSGPLVAPLICNQSQEETLEMLRKEPLTIVTGPPGTGKTQLVVNAVANAWLDNDSVLVTSTNNAAVDVAVDRAEKDVFNGLLVRTGNRETREQIPDRIAVASSRAASHSNNQSTVRANLKRIADQRAKLQAQLTRLDKVNEELLCVVEEREELELKQKSASLSIWGSENPPKLSISSNEIKQRAVRLIRAWLFRRLRIRRLYRRVECNETTSLDDLVRWAEKDQRMAWLANQMKVGLDLCKQLESAVGDPVASIRDADNKWNVASLSTIQADVAARIRSGSGRLAAFGTMPANVDQFKKAIANSLPYLRGWACTALSAHRNFKLESGLFDLVIVDEASQCSLAAVLPLAYRAKRLVLVGDPNQLSPIIPLSDRHLQEIATQLEFDNNELRERGIHHKDGSAYHAFKFAANPSEPALLNEHYRCHPYIARWFNTVFYNDELTILTEVSNLDGRHRAITWIDVEGVAERPKDGSWVNRFEAEQTVKVILEVIRAGYKNVGVVTPFVAQANLITKITQKHISMDTLDEIDLVCGTAHRLQGDERDVVVISSVLSPGMSKAGTRWIEKERNLLNVAVSRAKRALMVIGHPCIGELGSPTLSSLRVFLRETVVQKEGDVGFIASFRTDSRSEELLLEAMQLRNLSPYAKLNVEGYELDFALLENGIKLNVEVDGDHHLDVRGWQRRQDVTRDRVLSNLGWKVLRISAWRCYEEIDSVIDEITKERDVLIQQSP